MDERSDNSIELKAEWRNYRPCLEVNYVPAEMFKPHTAKLLAEQFIENYRNLTTIPVSGAKRNICIVVIKATVAGSPLVRALFDLYKVVVADSAKLICVSFPEDYMDSLTGLGLPALPGFKLASSLDEAFTLADKM
jgi:hypothetical protein